MRFLLPLTLITICLFSCTQSYNLIGEWILSTEHLDYIHNQTETNITFTFVESINPQNTIARTIAISACRTMYYTFSYKQNSIVPIFVRFGNTTRSCQVEELNQIRRKMESVFYFSIIDTRLILIYPSKQVAFTLFKNTTLSTGLKGNWTLLEVNGKNIENEKIEIKDDKILLCEGNIVLQYKLEPNNKIRISEVSNSDCPNKQELIKTLKNSQYYSKDKNQLYLYDSGINPAIKAAPTYVEPVLTPFSKQTLHDKWYIYSINGTQLDQQTEPIYYYYFLIITAERFRFYGGCNVEFSFYDFVNGNQISHRDPHYVKKPNCRYVNQDTLVLNSLFDQGKYLSYNETTGILSFFDSQKKSLMEFTTIMPKTRDILPESN